MTTETKTKPVEFLAKAAEQRLVVEPAWQTFGPTGRIMQADQGKAVEFEAHRFTTDDPELIEWLRSHRLFNVSFWEEGAAPDEPKPTVAEQQKAIASAAVRQDVEKLADVIRVEKETHNREPVLLAAEAALEEIAGEDESEETLEADEPVAEGARSSTSTD